MYFEDDTYPQIDIAYYGSPDVRWSHTTLAELFGRKVINGLLEGRRESYLAYYARLAGSYARLVIEEREAQDARNRAYREELARGFEAVQHGFGGRHANQ